MLKVDQQLDYNLAKICLKSAQSWVKLSDKWMISWRQILSNIWQRYHFHNIFFRPTESKVGVWNLTKHDGNRF